MTFQLFNMLQNQAFLISNTNLRNFIEYLKVPYRFLIHIGLLQLILLVDSYHL